MSKQFIVDRHTTPGTPALDPVNSPKVPVYDDLADATADLSNLAEGQIIATKDSGNELLHTTDTVQAGNMHPVTSNAVSKSLSYSTTEQLTGAKWIDGKPIYRKVINCGALPNATSKAVAHNITNIDYVVSMQGVASIPAGNKISLPFVDTTAFSNGVQMYITSNDVVLQSQANRSDYTDTYVTIEYTKTTD